jgi:N-methylhydantoinase B
VAAGNVETSQRIVDVVLGALAPALPERIPAASAGTMNNLAIGGWDRTRGRSFAYYETVGGGAGAGPRTDGLAAVHTHMTNTMNTPVEALEMAYPVRLVEYSVRRGSGGDGRHRGGDGIRRTWEFLAPAAVSLLTERRRRPPWGLAGGQPGQPGCDVLRRASGEEGELPSKGQVKAERGDRLTLDTPGGGGWGELP